MIALNQTDKPAKWCPGLTRDMDLTRGLLRYYPLWEGSGRVVTDLRGANGVFSGTPTWASGESRFGGPMASFGGVSDFLTLPKLALPAKSASAFVVFRSNDVSATQMLFTQGDINGGNFAILITVSGIYGLWAQDGTGLRATTLVPIVNDTWYHVAFAFNGIDTRLYLNGELKVVADATGSSLGTGRYATRFGTRPDAASQLFAGDLVEFGVYDRALSAAEVVRSYRSSFELCRMGRRYYPAAAVAGPYRVATGCVWHSGAEVGDVQVAGAEAGSIYVAGQQAGRVHG